MRGLILFISCIMALQLHAEDLAPATPAVPSIEQAPKREPGANSDRRRSRRDKREFAPQLPRHQLFYRCRRELRRQYRV